MLEDNSFDAFAAVFMQAYDMSCKGCTTYCPNDITGAALRPLADTPTGPQNQPDVKMDTGSIVYMTQPQDRPERPLAPLTGNAQNAAVNLIHQEGCHLCNACGDSKCA